MGNGFRQAGNRFLSSLKGLKFGLSATTMSLKVSKFISKAVFVISYSKLKGGIVVLVSVYV